MSERPAPNTQDHAYTTRLLTHSGAWWKRLLHVQAPYRWNLRRLHPGFTLDIGCGIGRNLLHLDRHGVGVDHNPHSVAIARQRGCQAFTEAELFACAYAAPERFDSLLLAHVAEHMTRDQVVALLARYLPLLKCGGKVIFMTPQERGYQSDRTHVHFYDFDQIAAICQQVRLTVIRNYSFPFPRSFGSIFRHNEFIAVACKHAPSPEDDALQQQPVPVK